MMSTSTLPPELIVVYIRKMQCLLSINCHKHTSLLKMITLDHEIKVPLGFINTKPTQLLWSSEPVLPLTNFLLSTWMLFVTRPFFTTPLQFCSDFPVKNEWSLYFSYSGRESCLSDSAISLWIAEMSSSEMIIYSIGNQ